jgi:hypothetical protein
LPKVNALNKARSEAYSQEEACLKFNQVDSNSRLSCSIEDIVVLLFQKQCSEGNLQNSVTEEHQCKLLYIATLSMKYGVR